MSFSDMHAYVTVYIRLMVPRGGNQSTIVIRPFDIFGSDVDVLIELNPDEKVGNL
jgi:hypothetical protein